MDLEPPFSTNFPFLSLFWANNEGPGARKIPNIGQNVRKFIFRYSGIKFNKIGWFPTEFVDRNNP